MLMRDHPIAVAMRRILIDGRACSEVPFDRGRRSFFINATKVMANENEALP